MVLKIRVPHLENFKWFILDHVDYVSLITKKSFIVDLERETSPPEILGPGPEYYVIEISRNRVTQKLAFSGVAFICNDEGKTLETLDGSD